MRPEEIRRLGDDEAFLLRTGGYKITGRRPYYDKDEKEFEEKYSPDPYHPK